MISGELVRKSTTSAVFYGYGVKNHLHAALFETDDGGHTWHQVALPCKADYVEGGQIAVDPTSHSLWFTCLGNSFKPGVGAPTEDSKAIYRSLNGGQNWILESSFSANGRFPLLTSPPNIAPEGLLEYLVPLSSTTAVALTTYGLVRTTDGGATWTTLRGTYGVTRTLGSLVFIGNDGWAAVPGSGFWRSDDGGKSWHQVVSRITGPSAS
jgi:photosystem II stability/assembly factor-like uncharacterized protein